MAKLIKSQNGKREAIIFKEKVIYIVHTDTGYPLGWPYTKEFLTMKSAISAAKEYCKGAS